MSQRHIPEEVLSRIQSDREAIKQELPELVERDARMCEAAAEDTLCGHLRQAIHQSRRPLDDIARDAAILPTVLCDFLAGERTLRSDVIDRLAHAVGVTVSVTPHATR